jgi:hypothetical protein
MERAARVIGKLRVADDEKLARAAWPAAVGKRLANRTGAVALFGSKMIVNVEDTVWQHQLWCMREQILTRLEKVLGRKIVTTIEFRVVPPRITPQPAEILRDVDEADAIASPSLRNIYRASRKKANG